MQHQKEASSLTDNIVTLSPTAGVSNMLLIQLFTLIEYIINSLEDKVQDEALYHEGNCNV